MKRSPNCSTRMASQRRCVSCPQMQPTQAKASRPRGCTAVTHHSFCSTVFRSARSAEVGRCLASTSDGRSAATSESARSGASTSAPTEVYDRLITVFQKRPRSEWPQLMASSKQWPTLAEGVFERISQQAEEQPDPTQASRLRRLQRHIKQTYNSLGRFRELVEQFFQTPPAEWECVVVMYQRELKEEFFDHVDDMIAREKGTDQKEQLLAMKARVQVLVQAFEEVAKNPEAMDTAAERFDAMLTKFQSLEQSDREIDEMSKRGEIDGALLFTAAKARAAANAQGSAGVQELMNCMYLKIKQASAKQKPPEMVVLEEAMAIEDEKERAFFLDEVFGLASSPAAGEGAEAYGRQGGKVNVEDLYSMICAVLQVFEKQGGVDPSSPKALRRLQEMQRLVWDRYLLSKTALPVDIEKQQELLGRVVEPEPRSTSSQ